MFFLFQMQDDCAMELVETAALQGVELEQSTKPPTSSLTLQIDMGRVVLELRDALWTLLAPTMCVP